VSYSFSLCPSVLDFNFTNSDVYALPIEIQAVSCVC
jgi:hypothetical protein